MIEALKRLVRNEDGNLAPMFALTLLPVLGLIGITVDYTQSSARKAALDSIADSAALAAVTPAMLASSDQVSINTAITLFNSQAPLVKGVGPITLNVTVSDNGLSRTMTVSYQTTSSTLFGGYTGKSSLPISGSSQSSATVPPNIDFYLLLDNSPSMAIAATSSGISTMVANTPDQCAFGCHESDTLPNDYYGLARSLGVTLRMDLLTQAVQNLMGTAQSTASTNNATYRAGIYTFNIGFNTITTLTSSLSVAQAQAANIQLYEVPYQNWKQRHDHELHECDDADQLDHAESGRRHQHRRRHAAGGAFLRDRRGRGRDRQWIAGAVADEHVLLHHHQEPRHPHRRALHDLSAAADQLLVQQLYRAVPAQHRLEPAELRVARPLFPGVDRPGHLGRAGAALQYRGGNRPSHEIAGILVALAAVSGFLLEQSRARWFVTLTLEAVLAILLAFILRNMGLEVTIEVPVIVACLTLYQGAYVLGLLAGDGDGGRRSGNHTSAASQQAAKRPPRRRRSSQAGGKDGSSLIGGRLRAWLAARRAAGGRGHGALCTHGAARCPIRSSWWVGAPRGGCWAFGSSSRNLIQI
jgi:Flp pilus assembly protein TadG